MVGPARSGTHSLDAVGGAAGGSAVGSPAAQLAAQVVPLRRDGDGTHRLTVQLQPVGLGPVSVTAEIRGTDIQLHLAGGTDAGRDALRSALPQLHQELTQAGFTTTTVDLQNTPTNYGTPTGPGGWPGGGAPGGAPGGGWPGGAGRGHGGPAERGTPTSMPESPPTNDPVPRRGAGTTGLDVHL
jgi:hypothetical protein